MSESNESGQRRRGTFIAAWTPEDVAQAFREVAAEQNRTVSGELRRLIELRVAEVRQERGSERATIPG